MKTPNDPRHQRRIDRMQKLFAHSFGQNIDVDKTIAPVIAKIEHIDKTITDAAPEWPVEKIAKVDLAILRLAVFELLEETAIPPKVVIDEAVELAKAYGNESSAKFVNGALGAVLKKLEKTIA